MHREVSTVRGPSTPPPCVVKSNITTCLLVPAVWSTVFLGPWWLSTWIAGFLNVALLWLLSRACFFLLGWPVLFAWACVRFIQGLCGQQKVRAALWLTIAIGIVLAYAQLRAGKTPSDHGFFGRGILARLEVRTDIDSVRTWVMSLDPNDCMTEGYSSEPQPCRYLKKEDQPQVLRRQSGMVTLELDAQGRPCVRLGWDQSKDGIFGVVIGHSDMKTPPSEPGMYGEKHTELRPGIYFWYLES